MALQNVGFIGLGAMGLPMAKNLVHGGYHLHVTAHRNKKPVEELKIAGATEHTSLSELAAKSDVLISILPTDKEMESVLLSEDILHNLPQHCILVEMTSGSPAAMKKVFAAYNKKGISVLDAPVSGGTAGAKNGALTVMAGGESNVLEEVRSVLEVMAKQIYLVGEIGAGKAIKAINQMLAATHMVIATEAVALAEKLEIDKEMVKQVIGNSSGASWMLLNKIDSLSERNFDPGFKLGLMKKDVQIAVDEAKDVDLEFGAHALKLFQEAEKDMGDLDFSAICKHILT